MGDYTYELSLWVEHPTDDLAELPKQLGMPVVTSWKQGDNRVTPSGRTLPGVRRTSYCSIEMPVSHDLPSGLRGAVNLLRSHKALLTQFSDRGATMRLFVGWYSDHNSRDVLDWTILRDLAELRISLDLDIYGPDAGRLASQKP